MNYLDKLRASAGATGSIACMGLDPVVEALPEQFRWEGIAGVVPFFEAIFNKMIEQGVSPAAFKPNQGFYLQHDQPRRREPSFVGSVTLARVMDMIDKRFPRIPIILDFKRGDIAKSSANHAREGFQAWEAQAVTVAPYMGTDSISPFAKWCNDVDGRGVYVLDRTSNPGGIDFQSLEVAISRGTRKPLHVIVADKIVDWARESPGLGAVVGATSLDELETLAGIYARSGVSVPLLIPGVGGQGGKADEVMAKLRATNYDLSLVRINSSSGITHPWAKKKEPAPENYAEVCVEKLRSLNEAIDYPA